MKIQKNTTEPLLDALDKTLNSNTAWLSFPIYANQYFELNRFLVHQLRSGMFHLKLVENDLSRGWENLISITYSKFWKDKPIIIPLPGNCWNGKEDLNIREISEKRVIDYLMDLLTGADKWLPKRPTKSLLKKKEAEKLIQDFLTPLRSKPNKMVTYYLIEPDFLHTVDDYYKSNYTQIGYFESRGADFVLAILIEDHNTDTHCLNLLLTNGDH